MPTNGLNLLGGRWEDVAELSDIDEFETSDARYRDVSQGQRLKMVKECLEFLKEGAQIEMMIPFQK